ncbi:alpha/beta hydrolase-fold protein [Brevibacillus sedimenti]|uniref:alpha/beta hydrolase-fold protein n=1 Tax=Brevibacillus sedimenti TaxID=2613334 RepID=UPI001E44AAC6|nr:alpha/beta hydrolase-fold protein [Anoxybacillus sediminis]
MWTVTTPLTAGAGANAAGRVVGRRRVTVTALAYPHTFGQVACQSAAMDEALNRRVAEAELPASLHVYLEVGTEETAVETSRGTLNLLAANERLRDILQTKGVTLAYETFAGDHTWGYWQANLPRMLRALFG